MATQTASKVSEALAQLVSGIAGGGIRVVDLTIPLEPSTQTIQLHAAVRSFEAVLPRGNFSLRPAGPGMVLE